MDGRPQFSIFRQGANTATLRINGGSPLEIGLDHLFRKSDAEPFGELLLRGEWSDDQTFVVEYPYPFVTHPRLGDLGDVAIQFRFEGDQVQVSIIQQVFGGDPISFGGAR